MKLNGRGKDEEKHIDGRKRETHGGDMAASLQEKRSLYYAKHVFAPGFMAVVSLPAIPPPYDHSVQHTLELLLCFFLPYARGPLVSQVTG